LSFDPSVEQVWLALYNTLPTRQDDAMDVISPGLINALMPFQVIDVFLFEMI
jgi:hypothetical protein